MNAYEISNFLFDTFTSKVGEWNTTVFGHIGRRKKQLLARLRGIDRALSLSHSTSLVKLGGKLRLELEEVMHQEESFWRQKACAKWIVEGDRNTSFFHASTMARRRSNFISGLKVDGNDWCDSQDVLRLAAVDFYQNLFQSSGDSDNNFPIRGRKWRDIEVSALVFQNTKLGFFQIRL
ncbi:hypothetical protein GQ457_12G025900 [Hibiscus cannabinus]